MLASTRYFFNLVSDREVIPDENGIDLPVTDSIMTSAVLAMEELEKEDFFASGEWQEWRLQITDGAGRTVLTFPLGSSAVERNSLALP
jgi:hypothetical protein